MSAFPVRELPPARVSDLARTAEIHPITARCLLARGIDSAERARKFLEPRLDQLRPPVGLADLEPAVARIAAAVIGGETVGVFGDYDVDGVTTAALLTSVLRAFGATVVPRVASRHAGYGFNPADAEALAAAGATLIITGDCGTSDLDAIEAARRAGADVVVIDHHTVPDSVAEHPALALINPFRADSTFEFPHFASVGLAFYVMQSARSHLRRRGYFADHHEPDLRRWLDLVALGTIADLVPLIGENRVLTSLGLRSLDLRLRPGIRALLAVAGVPADRAIGEREVGWTLAPRLNAPGRLGDAAPALELLLATDADEADRLAAELERANDDRRLAQAQAAEEAERQLEVRPPGACVVVAGAGWKPGVVGIVAARLVDEYQRPAFVIAIDADGQVGRGSARTSGGVDIYRALAGASEHMIRFGGHAAAAGLTIEADRIDDLRAALELEVEAQLSSRPVGPELADAAIAPGDLTVELVRELTALGPFGKGNPAIRLVAENLEVDEARLVGADARHLKLRLRGGGVAVGAIGFGLAERLPERGDAVDVAFAPLLNRWRGTERAEMRVVALEPSAARRGVAADRPGVGAGVEVADTGLLEERTGVAVEDRADLLVGQAAELADSRI